MNINLSNEPGVIEKNKYGLIYHVKKLQLDRKTRKLVILGIICFFASSFMIPFGSGLVVANEVCNDTKFGMMTPSQRQYNFIAVYVFLFLLLELMPLLITLYLMYLNISRCFFYQFVKCVDTLLDVALLTCEYLALGLATIFTGTETCSTEINTSLACFCCVQLGWFYSAKYFSKQNCRCKTCLNLKDVKLCYLDQSIDTSETQEITKEFLLTKFNISQSSEICLALQLENGRIIHTFTNDSSVQLHEGRYKIVVRTSGGVHIRYLAGNASKSMPVTTKFNAKLLKKWLKIDTNGVIVVQNERSNNILYTLHNQMENFSLPEGDYIIKIMHMEGETKIGSESDNTAKTVNESSKQPECSILNID